MYIFTIRDLSIKAKSAEKLIIRLIWNLEMLVIKTNLDLLLPLEPGLLLAEGGRGPRRGAANKEGDDYTRAWYELQFSNKYLLESDLTPIIYTEAKKRQLKKLLIFFTQLQYNFKVENGD